MVAMTSQWWQRSLLGAVSPAGRRSSEGGDNDELERTWVMAGTPGRLCYGRVVALAGAANGEFLARARGRERLRRRVPQADVHAGFPGRSGRPADRGGGRHDR